MVKENEKIIEFLTGKSKILYNRFLIAIILHIYFHRKSVNWLLSLIYMLT